MRAFLFDLDGTLIDSMPHHHAAWVEWHARHGLVLDEPGFFAATAGRSNHEILRELLPGRADADYDTLAGEKERLYRDIAASQLALIGGAAAYLDRARAAGLRLAVCTASTLPNMALAFARFGIDGWVDAVVSPADTAGGTAGDRPLRGKPHPDIFLEAARRLGVAPGHCLVFEDAPLGVEAARRAGMRAVALTTTLPAEDYAAFDNVVAIAPDFHAEALSRLIDAPDHPTRGTSS